MTVRTANAGSRSQRGVSLFLVALGLTILLGIAALAIDLAMLYVARNEAQRAADAAALAGAKYLQSSDLSAGGTADASAATSAALQATAMGNQDSIVGRSPALDVANFNIPGGASNTCPPPAGKSGGCFNFETANDPQITVVAYVTMPTFFVRIFGIRSVPVSATATAEAYSGPNVSVPCVKPWLLANCDPHFGGSIQSGSPYYDPYANANCPCQASSGSQAADPCYTAWQKTTNSNKNDPFFADEYVDPNTGNIVHDVEAPAGAIGEGRIVKPGSPSQSMVPSQFLPVFLVNSNGSIAGGYTCPSCAANDQSNAQQGNSAALYRENIECCSTEGIACGLNTISAITGNKVGPTGSAVDCLIHQQSSGTGQDCISFDPSAPTTCPGAVYNASAFPPIVYAGADNPYPGVAEGQALQSSDSLVTLPLYAGYQLCSGGGSCPSTQQITVLGFLGIFITGEGSPQNTVSGYVVSITSCGAGGMGGSGTPISAAPGSPIVVRLIHN